MSAYQHCDYCKRGTNDPKEYKQWYSVVGPEQKIEQTASVFDQLLGVGRGITPIEFCSADCVAAYFFLKGLEIERSSSS